MQYVTYDNLIQIVIFIVALTGLIISRKDKKIDHPSITLSVRSIFILIILQGVQLSTTFIGYIVTQIIYDIKTTLILKRDNHRKEYCMNVIIDNSTVCIILYLCAIIFLPSLTVFFVYLMIKSYYSYRFKENLKKKGIKALLHELPVLIALIVLFLLIFLCIMGIISSYSESLNLTMH